jgi:hypothetical protein
MRACTRNQCVIELRYQAPISSSSIALRMTAADLDNASNSPGVRLATTMRSAPLLEFVGKGVLLDELVQALFLVYNWSGLGELTGKGGLVWSKILWTSGLKLWRSG